MEIKKYELVQLKADEGKIFARKDDGTMLGYTLHLGVNDSPDNYIEIDEPKEEEVIDVTDV